MVIGIICVWPIDMPLAYILTFVAGWELYGVTTARCIALGLFLLTPVINAAAMFHRWWRRSRAYLRPGAVILEKEGGKSEKLPWPRRWFLEFCPK
jgi:hypothetical protein